jgi:hypothetical protein
MQVVFARQQWPIATGVARNKLALDGSTSTLVYGNPGGTGRRLDTFTPSANNTNWVHNQDVLILAVTGQDKTNGDMIYGLNIEVEFLSVNKWA